VAYDLRVYIYIYIITVLMFSYFIH